MEDRLQEMFKKQQELMIRLKVKTRSTGELSAMTPEQMEDLTDETRVIAFALLDEVHEMIRELNWKPWKKTLKPVDLEKVQKELIDAWHFLIELSLMWGLSAERVQELYLEKNKENHQRQDSNY